MICLRDFVMLNLKKKEKEKKDETSEMINIISWTLMHFLSVCLFTKFDRNNSIHDVELEFKMKTTVIFYCIKNY